MIPVLFYTPGTCAFGSIVALEWLAAPYRLSRVENDDIQLDTFRALNPLAQVPVFKTGDGVLTESAAILAHIAFLGIGKKIGYRQGTKEFDHLNQVMAFLTTSLHTSISPVMHADRFADDYSAQEDVVHKAKTHTIPARLKNIEGILAKQSWLAGAQPTVADAYFYGVARATKKFINLDKDFPKIAGFFEKFSQDPGVIFAHGIEDAKSPKSKGGFKGDVGLNLVS